MTYKTTEMAAVLNEERRENGELAGIPHPLSDKHFCTGENSIYL